MVQKLMRRLTTALGIRLERAGRDIARKSMPRFGNNPKNLTIQLPRRIQNPERMVIGDDVSLGPNCVLSANTRYPGSWMRHPEGRHVDQTFEPELTIGDRVTASAALQVFTLGEITIGNDVMFASNIFICDSLHGYANGEEPYKYQGMTPPEPIRIGEGCWIGQNVVILPGVTIGAFSIVGANSVVTKDIPPQSIAMGAPAQVTKRWNNEAKGWQRTEIHPDSGPPLPAHSASERAIAGEDDLDGK